jgi:hypothetical protein
MRRALIPTLFAAVIAACSDNASTATSPTSLTMTTEMFTGTLSPGGLRFYSFRATEDSAISAMLASLSTAVTRALPELAVGLGVGIPQGTGCDVKEAVTTTAGLTRQFRGWATEGIHCVAVYDVGNLRESVSFAIQIAHY